MYQSLVLVDPDSHISAEQLASELRRFYNGKDGAPRDIRLSGNDVILEWPDYTLETGRSSLQHVLQESAWLAAEFAADRADRDRISQCACRFELSGDADLDTDHFNDYLFVGEALARLGRVYRFDQAASEFVE